MKIKSIGLALPSRVVTNNDVVDLIRKHSTGFQGDLPATLKIVDTVLKRSGANERCWLGSGESPRGLMKQACVSAMKGLARGAHIDLLIYASIWPELVEPSTANLLAHEIGLDSVECFDVLESCAGWVKAAKIARGLMESRECRNVMIVNGEFGMVPSAMIYPKLFTLTSPTELEWRFPAFTIGEAATATILGPNSGTPWRFCNTTENNLYDLCTITPGWYGQHPIDSLRVAKDGAGIFTSYGSELRQHGLPLCVEIFKKSGINPDDVDIFLTHSSSKSDWAEMARQVGLEEKIYDTYARTGNIVSASIPAAMALALREGKLRRGQKVAVCVAAAGMTFDTAEFTF